MTGTKHKTPYWATFFTLFGAVILCSLGTWQLMRLEWKKVILNDLKAAYENPIQGSKTENLKDIQNITYMTVKGRFLFEKSILLGHTVKDGTPGHYLITPLKTQDKTLLINIGFNPKDSPLETHTLKQFNNKEIELTGLIRKPSWNFFTPENNPDKDIWYRANIEQIAKTKEIENPYHLVMYAEKAHPKIDEELPNHERWQPNNNHLQYALFWYSLAAALIVIYILRFFRRQN